MMHDDLNSIMSQVSSSVTANFSPFLERTARNAENKDEPGQTLDHLPTDHIRYCKTTLEHERTRYNGAVAPCPSNFGKAYFTSRAQLWNLGRLGCQSPVTLQTPTADPYPAPSSESIKTAASPASRNCVLEDRQKRRVLLVVMDVSSN
jgi:hypothetical protein